MFHLSKSMLEMTRYSKRSKTTQHLISFYDGPVPTKLDIDTLDRSNTVNQSIGQFRSDLLHSWLLGTNGNSLVAQCRVDNFVNLDFREGLATLNLSHSKFEVEVLKNGAPTWFIVINPTSTETLTMSNPYQIDHLIMGTFGAVGSGAEMLMKDGTFEMGKVYKINDITIEEI